MVIKLSKSDARRALVRHHFTPCDGVEGAFERLRSIQFDPIAPAGCNHDLVLQSRVDKYKIGDWERLAYQQRKVYDGWDKQASLIPFEGWTMRRVFYDWAEASQKILDEHPEATAAVLREIEKSGPMQPKDFELQEHRPEWRGTWYGASLTKNILRRLWNTGRVMTSGRKKGQHLYDLTERVVPPEIYRQPKPTEEESIRAIVLERHRAMGMLRPNASPEIWASRIYLAGVRAPAIKELVGAGRVVPVEVEGMKTHATPEFLRLLDEPSLEPAVRFIAPLDQLVWDRKMLGHIFGFDYIWEIYTPEAKRRWGYYVLPVLFGDELVGRIEFWARAGVLEIRRWHWEGNPPTGFWAAYRKALRRFMRYCSAEEVRLAEGIDPRLAI